MGIKRQMYTRKTHRYLGLFIGVQFLFWTIGGLYFSWNDMDDVHGETLLDKTEHTFQFSYNDPVRKLLTALQEIDSMPIETVEGIVVNQDSLLRVSRKDDIKFINLSKNSIQGSLSKAAAVSFVLSRLYEKIDTSHVEYFTEKDITKGHEYRGNPLPVYAITMNHPTNTTVYVHPEMAKIMKVRNDNWRRFDFLWMMHVMDFETRRFHYQLDTTYLFCIGIVNYLVGTLSFFYQFAYDQKTQEEV